MKVERVFVGVGGNLGDSKTLFRSAISQLGLLPETQVVALSSVYKTPPMGPEDQDDYSNMVLGLDTGLKPLALLDALQSIEQNHGRVRKNERWGARTLDLDILLFGQQVIDEPRLRVPHYGMNQRNFVIVPLHEVVGEGFVLPMLGALDKIVLDLAGEPIENLGTL